MRGRYPKFRTVGTHLFFLLDPPLQYTVASLYAGRVEEIFRKKATESSQEAVFLGSGRHFKWS